MERYDYRKAVCDDINDYLQDNYEGVHISPGKREEIKESLWVDDSVTGNGSGSYTFNAWRAEENLCHNTDLLLEALSEFGSGLDYVSRRGPEAADVTIRCYLLGQLLDEVIDRHNEAIYERKENT